MKIKIASILAILLLCKIGFSQENEDSFFPKKNTKSIELNLKPFNSEELISFDYLQFKYYLSDNHALRLGVKFNQVKNIMDEDDNHATDGDLYTATEESAMLGTKLGFEYHILKNRRISPYVGLELQLVNQSASAEYVNKFETETYVDEYGYVDATISESTTIDGSWINTTEIQTYVPTGWGGYAAQTVTVTDYEKSRAYTAFGGNLLMGADVYVMKNMYLGFELGLGYLKHNYKKITVENEVSIRGDFPTVIESEEDKLPSLSTTAFKFYYNSAFRLGIYF